MTAQSKQGMVIRVGIVGCGAITERAHIPALTKLQDKFRVSALVDRSQERTAALAAIAGTSPEQLVDTEKLPDVAEIALVATPPHSHAAVVEPLLRRGIHVLVEKPFARTPVECETMLSAASAGSATLTVGVNRRYFRSWRLIQTLKQTGLLGQLVSVVFEEGAPFNWPVVTYSNFDPEVAGGGVLLDTGAHSVDAVIWLAGRKPHVLLYEDDNQGGVEANCLLVMTDGQAMYSIRLSRTHNLMNRLVAVFEKGTVSADCWDGSPYGVDSWVIDGDKNVRSLYEQISKELPADPFEAEWSALHERVASGAPSDSTAADSATGIALIRECYDHREPMKLSWIDSLTRERSGVA